MILREAIHTYNDLIKLSSAHFIDQLDVTPRCHFMERGREGGREGREHMDLIGVD